MPERIRVQQVVEITGLSVRQIQGMAARGQIPSAAQLGRLWTFREDSIRAWIADREAHIIRRAEKASKALRSLTTRAPFFQVPRSDAEIQAAYERAIGLKRSKGKRSKRGG
jgi:predicted DNA-binding transcriptional regulator AlpA